MRSRASASSPPPSPPPPSPLVAAHSIHRPPPFMSVRLGAFMPGEFEERMKVVLKELTETPGKYILFIDDIHTVTGPNAQQGGGVMDASVLLKPLLRCDECGEG